MSGERIKSYTISDILEKIDSNSILLPSMQRKFVWQEEKIINLFDSIMKGYPFGDFIFWTINNKEKINEYQFYSFIKNYSYQTQTMNEKAGKIIKDKIEVVMDGQQRLTSLFIGIKGSLTTIDKYLKKKYPENWKTKQLYIKPYISAEEKNNDETPYRFVFLDSDDANTKNANKEDYDKYYLVSDFYGKTKDEWYEELGVQRIKTKHDSWKSILEKLRSRINDEKIINVYNISNTNIYDVLEIFRRINNGGTPLSPSNLLFSTVITNWEKGREEMDRFIHVINQDKIINIKEDFLIRACLYLTNQPAAANIEILTKEVVNNIQESWVRIKNAIINTKNFLKNHNIHSEAILSYNAILPIAYYYYFSNGETQKSADEQLFYFYSISQLFSLFGGSSDTTLNRIRESMCINKELGKVIVPFSLSNLYEVKLSANRLHAFRITRTDVENLVDTVKYGDKKVFTLLSLLQPSIYINADYYDVDHICSKGELKAVFKKRRGDERDILEEKKNLISNLQLLNYTQNRKDKNAVPLYTWVVEWKNPIPHDPIPPNHDEMYKINEIEDFTRFYELRRQKVIDYLCKCFGIEK